MTVIISGNEFVLHIFYLLGSIFHPSLVTIPFVFSVRRLLRVLSFSICSVHLAKVEKITPRKALTLTAHVSSTHFFFLKFEITLRLQDVRVETLIQHITPAPGRPRD